MTDASSLSRDYLASFVEDDPMPQLETDPDGRCIYANPAAESRFPGVSELGLAHPALADLAALSEVMHSGTIGEVRTVEISADGSDFQVSALRLAERLRFYMADVTHRVRAEKLLSESERRFRATFEQAAVGIGHVRLDGTILRANQKLCEITGYPREVLESMHYRDLTHPDDLAYNNKLTRQLLNGEIDNFSLEQRYIRANGEILWVQLTGSLVRTPKGKPEYMVRVVRDVSRQKEAEEQAARELEISNVLLAAAGMLSRELDLTELCGTLAEMAVGLTGRSRAQVVINELDGENGVIVAGRGAHGRTGVRFALDTLPPQLHARLAQGDTIQVRTSDEGLSGIGRFFSADTPEELALFVPIMDSGRLVGVVVVDEPGSTEPYPERVVKLLQGVTAQASAAIRNARHYEREHTVASTLQDMLLDIPTDIHGIEYARRYRSASEMARVGGDFVDLFETEDCGLTVVLGDVSGKGVASAAATALVRNTIRALSIHGTTPEELLSDANEVVCRFTELDTFVTAFYGCLNTRTGTFDYAHVGHPPAMIVGRNGHVRVLDNINPVLGAIPGLEFGTGRFILEPDECLLLYTDGVTESRRGDDFYGIERLASTLAGLGGAVPEVVVERVLASVTEFAGGFLNDDIALLALRLAPDVG